MTSIWEHRGIPFVLKDNIDLAGIPTTAACEAFAYTPSESAFVVQQLLDAGALPLGATNVKSGSLSMRTVDRTDYTEVVVCGAHLQGMPLNWQLTQRGATRVESTFTSAEYRLFALQEKPPRRPALVRVDEEGAAIEVEVWRLPVIEVGSFLKGIAAPLGLGTVTLCCGRQVCGFIAEAVAGGEGSADITHFGGWRAYQQTLSDS